MKSRRCTAEEGGAARCVPYASGSMHITRIQCGRHPPKQMKAGVTTQGMSLQAAIMRMDGRHQPRSTPLTGLNLIAEPGGTWAELPPPSMAQHPGSTLGGGYSASSSEPARLMS